MWWSTVTNMWLTSQCRRVSWWVVAIEPRHSRHLRITGCARLGVCHRAWRRSGCSGRCSCSGPAARWWTCRARRNAACSACWPSMRRPRCAPSTCGVLGVTGGALRTSVSRLRRLVGDDALRTTVGGYRPQRLGPSPARRQCPDDEAARGQPAAGLDAGAPGDDVEQPAGADVDDRGRPQLVPPWALAGKERLVQPQCRGFADAGRVIDQGAAVGDHGVIDRVPVTTQLLGHLIDGAAVMTALTETPADLLIEIPHP